MTHLDSPNYKSLRALRVEGISIGVLASAIEARGIYAYDRFDRFREVAPVDALALRALDALADSVQRSASPNDETEDIDPMGSPWNDSGWPIDDLPDFESLAKGLVVRRSATGDANPGSEYVLIEALRRMLVRESGSDRSQRCSSNAQLISKIEEQHSGIRGLSKRNIEQMFAKSAKQFEAREKG